jgi:predicted nucleotidyltransferase
MQPAGYSGTPLAKKLGIKDGFKIKLANAPEYYLKLFSDFPKQTKMIKDDQTKVDFVHFFCTDAEELYSKIVALKNQLHPAGMVWISWYKKSAKIATDVTEDIIRQIAIQNCLVDIKVCAVDEKWSGLKLVIPVKDRALSK